MSRQSMIESEIFNSNALSRAEIVGLQRKRAQENDHVEETERKLAHSFSKVRGLVANGSMSPEQVREEREANIALNKSGYRALVWSNQMAEQQGSKVRLTPAEYCSDTVELVDFDLYEIT